MKTKKIFPIVAGIILLFVFIPAESRQETLREPSSVLPDQSVLQMFDDLIANIAALPNESLNIGVRTSLIEKLANAKAAYKRRLPCTAQM